MQKSATERNNSTKHNTKIEEERDEVPRDEERERERERRLIHNCGRETTNDEDTTVLQEGG